MPTITLVSILKPTTEQINSGKKIMHRFDFFFSNLRRKINNLYASSNLKYKHLRGMQFDFWPFHHMSFIYNNTDTGIEFKDFILGFRQSTFLCTTLKCIENFRIPFIKSGVPASNLGFTEARNLLKFAACRYLSDTAWFLNYICTTMVHDIDILHMIIT